jgi:hypothetical protein
MTDELQQAKQHEDRARRRYKRLEGSLQEARDEYRRATLEREILEYNFDLVDTPARRRRQDMLVLREGGMLFQSIAGRYGLSVGRAQALVHQAERDSISPRLSAQARKMVCRLLDLWDLDTILTTDQVLGALADVTNEQLLEWSGCGKKTIAELRWFEKLHRGRKS